LYNHRAGAALTGRCALAGPIIQLAGSERRKEGAAMALARWVRERQLDTRIILSSTARQSLGEAAEYATLLAKPYAVAEVQKLLKRMLLH
jgi:hypothetical protein